MSEKKRVTLMVDPKMCQGPNGASNDVFNFSGFQAPDPSAATSRPARAGNDEGDDETTTYQSGRKSIVEGVGAADLLHMHRKSLAQLRSNDGGAVNMQETFTGVTLSRRHRTTQQEYDAGRDGQTAAQLEGFSFGSAE